MHTIITDYGARGPDIFVTGERLLRIPVKESLPVLVYRLTPVFIDSDGLSRSPERLFLGGNNDSHIENDPNPNK